MPSPDVTICIPTWQAEGFIERTLGCAAAQTYPRLRILISVDHCADRTEALCRQFAQRDPRIEVLAQPERLGWSRNANALLDRVDTDFFFFYFHDDIIEPRYTERLRTELVAQPQAKSAHCDLERFGDSSGVKAGNGYQGTDCRRLVNFLAGPVKGAPLRSLTRSELLAGGLRFPLIGTDGFWRCHPYLVQLLAAGPAIHIPEVLYRQWFRPDSVTSKWAPKTAQELIEGQRENARLCLEIIARARMSDEEKHLVRFCLYVFVMTHTRRNERPLQLEELIDPLAISPAFRFAGPPPSLHLLDAEAQQWVSRSYADLQSMERKLASA